MRFSAFACWSNESEEKLKMDWLIWVKNSLRLIKKKWREQENQKKKERDLKVVLELTTGETAICERQKTKKSCFLRHQFQTNSVNTISTNYDSWNTYLIVLLSLWFRVWFGFVNALPSLYILFFYYAKSTLSNHTVLIQYIIPY